MPMRAEELYCAGMMHDIGYLILDRFMGTELDTALEQALNDKTPIHEQEEFLYGFTHADVGGLLAEKWGMTPMIQAAVKYHHNPQEDGNYFETTCFISAANVLAHQAGFTNNTVGITWELEPHVVKAVGIPLEQFDAIRDVMVQEVLKAQDTFKIQ